MLRPSDSPFSAYNVSMQNRVRIVLVSPSGPANVGAACRAMANMGFSKLFVVSPRCDLDDEQAIAYSTHGRHVLDSIRVVDTIRDALTGCALSFAMTARDGLYRTQAGMTAEEAARRTIQTTATGEVAFVFGPENQGLINEDLLEIDQIVHIPADPSYPVLNLAAAVMVMCYELQRTMLSAAAVTPEPADLALDEHKAAMYDHLFSALGRLGFLFGPNPDRLKYALRHLYGRANLTVNECDILTGMARQMHWYIDHHPRRIDPPDG